MPADIAIARPLAGRTIAFLETRRAVELTRLIARQGGSALVAPALREVPSEDDGRIRAWLEDVAAGRFDVVIFLTGSGCRALLERATECGILSAVLSGLGRARVVARGPKPVRVLSEYGVPVALVPPEPNTSVELLVALRRWRLAGQSVGLQVYGGSTPFLERLETDLAALGSRVQRVAPYRWEGPADEQGVRQLIAACLAGRVDALLILSSSQIQILFQIAEALEQEKALRRALNAARLLVAAVGPVAAQASLAHGVRVDLVPEHPKMGHLVAALAAAFVGARQEGQGNEQG
jgi:uroporphyrinogen-III synthase